MLKEESDFYYNIPIILQEINQSLKTIAEALKKERQSQELSPKYKKIIEEWVKEDFETGYPTDDYDEVLHQCIDAGFNNKATLGVDYYMELAQYGPAGFYEEFQDEFDDWDESFVAEYGDEEDEDVEEEDID